jgi:hypothetical protein
MLNPLTLTSVLKIAVVGGSLAMLSGCAYEHHHHYDDDREVVVVHDRPYYHDDHEHWHHGYYDGRGEYHHDRDWDDHH